MKIRVKWVLSAVLALVVGAVVAGYAVLATMDFENLRALAEEEAEKATGRKLAIAGPVDLQVSLSPAIALQNVAFGNASWGTWPQMLSIKEIEVEVRLLPLLSGDIEIKRLVLVEPVILLETDAQGRGNWVIAPAEGAEAGAGAPALPAFHRVDVRDGRLLYRDGRTGEEIELVLAGLQGQAESPASPIEVALSGAYNGHAFAAEGTLGSRDQLLRGGTFPLDLEIEAAGTTVKVAGEIDDPAARRGLDIALDARGQSLADLSGLAGASLPALGPYAVGGRIEGTAKAIKVTGLTATLGDSDLAGNATLDLGGARPAVSGALSAGTIHLANILPSREQAAAPDPERRFVFTEDPLPLDALRAVDVQLKLSIGRLRLREGITLSDLDAALFLKDGQLVIDPIRAGFSGGRLAGDLSLDARPEAPLLALNLAADGFDYGALLKDMDVTDGVTGTLDASARVTGAGASARALAAGLNGRIEVVGGEGWVRNDLLEASGAGLINMVSAWRAGENDLRLNCVVARLPVEDGVTTGEAILLDTAAVTVGATGKLDLRDETLDFRVTPQAKQTSLLSLAVPFLVGGTLLAPSIGPDPVGTAVGAAKIAGMFINPLAAGAVIILESEAADENPCVAALGQGGRARPESQPASQGETAIDRAAGALGGAAEGAGKAVEGVGDAVEGVGEGISKGLKGLFGN